MRDPRPKRVLMLLENNPYPQDVRVRGEAEALVGAGHAVTVLAPRAAGQRARETVAGVAVRRFRLPPDTETAAGILVEYAIAHVQLFGRGLWHLLARGADVVHLHNPPDTLFPLGLVAKLLGRRMVFDSHDLFPDMFSQKFGDSRLVGVLAAAQRASMRFADAVIATNESHAEVAASLRGGRDGVVVVRNGPRRESFTSATPVRDGALTDPRLAFLGSLGAHDGVLALPALLSALADDHGVVDAQLTVIGEGPARAELERGLAEAGLRDRVTFTGWVPYERVPELLAQSDICVDPAPCNRLNHHSTMIKIAEYLAAGRPVVARELVETRRTAGDAAILVPCDDERRMAAEIARLAGDAELRRSLAERARARRESLAWESSAEALCGAYAAL